MTWEQKDRDNFNSVVEDTLRVSVPGLDYRDSVSFRECMEIWQMTFAAYSPDYQMLNASEAGAKFKEFVSSLIPADVRKTVECSVSIGRTYGTEIIQFGLTDMSERRKTAIQGTYGNLVKIVLSEHDDYAARHLPKSPAPQNSNGNGKEGQGIVTQNEFKANRLSLSIEDGKKTYKLHGEQWSKFGVKVWPEVLKRAGIDPDKVPIQGLDFDPELNCKVMLKSNGQPDKVAAISKG